MTQRILLVDDEPNVLLGYQRALRARYELDVASSGLDALELISSKGPYAIVVSDMRMPEMNGIELLSTIKAQSPNTVRMMLTGNSDQKTAIDAINHGDIFRFLNKPCSKDVISQALDDGLYQYRLVTAEKELLQKTLAGSIRVLAEVLSLANPSAFGRTARLKKLHRLIVDQLGIEREWWMEPAILLSQIGCVTLPEKLSKKVAGGQSLDNDEFRQYARHPNIGADLLEKIPRMEEIVACIRYQEKHFDGTGIPHDGVRGNEIPRGARILKVAIDYDRGEMSGLTPQQSLLRMKRQSKFYDPVVLEALSVALIGKTPAKILKVHIHDLRDGAVLAEDVRTGEGILLAARGLVISMSVQQRLENYLDNKQIAGYVKIIDDNGQS